MLYEQFINITKYELAKMLFKMQNTPILGSSRIRDCHEHQEEPWDTLPTVRERHHMAPALSSGVSPSPRSAPRVEGCVGLASARLHDTFLLFVVDGIGHGERRHQQMVSSREVDSHGIQDFLWV